MYQTGSAHGRKWLVLCYVFLTTYCKQMLLNFSAFDSSCKSHKTFLSWSRATRPALHGLEGLGVGRGCLPRSKDC